MKKYVNAQKCPVLFITPALYQHYHDMSTNGLSKSIYYRNEEMINDYSNKEIGAETCLIMNSTNIIVLFLAQKIFSNQQL